MLNVTAPFKVLYLCQFSYQSFSQTLGQAENKNYNNTEVGLNQDSKVLPKYIIGKYEFGHTDVLLKSDLDVQQASEQCYHLYDANKSSSLAPALGVTQFKFTDVIYLILLRYLSLTQMFNKQASEPCRHFYDASKSFSLAPALGVNQFKYTDIDFVKL